MADGGRQSRGGCHLPDSIWVEILTRLPLKSVFRFKCVSKHWLALISDPSFAISYVLNATPSHHLPWTILYARMYNHHFPSAPSYKMRFDNFLRSSSDDDFQFPGFSVMFPPGLPREDFSILVSSNGLLLCRWQKEVYFVANPLTRKWVSLRRHTRLFPGVSEGFLTNLDEPGNAVTGFKVVRLDRLSHPGDVFRVKIFSSETGEWTDSMLPCPRPIQLLESGGPIVYNGIPHWCTRQDGLVAYDHNNPCRLIKLPEDRDMETDGFDGGIYRLCNVCHGHLKYFEVAEIRVNPSFNVWVLKDYDTGEWCLEQRTRLIDTLRSDERFFSSSNLNRFASMPAAFDQFELDMVYLSCRGHILSYNISTRRLKVHCYHGSCILVLSWQVIVPFVLPTWPMPVPHFSWKGIQLL